MHVLVLGGTQFIGRHVVEHLLQHGHRVSIFTRGLSPDPLPAGVERLRGDRNLGPEGLASLRGKCWDVCVDVSGYTPVQVGATAELLRDQVQHLVFFSAVRVYGDPINRPVLETHPLLPPADSRVTEFNGETYGPLKVSCEGVVQEVFAGCCTVLRPQVVVGTHDPSLRYTHWINRAALPGPMLAPGDGTDHLQVIDVRDVARFTVLAAEKQLQGAFNLAGPRLTWQAFMDLLEPPDPVWVPKQLLQAARLDFQTLPLYRPEHGAFASLMEVSSVRAREAGLTLTDPAVTLQDTRAWSLNANLPLALPLELEKQLIAQVRREA